MDRATETAPAVVKELYRTFHAPVVAFDCGKKCAEGNPFMIFGALGSDVIPPVRNWAEQNKELYLYGFTVKAGSEHAKYTYSATISQEELSALLGDVAATRFAGKKVGVVWRNSSNFQPGRDAFMTHLHPTPAAGIAVTRS